MNMKMNFNTKEVEQFLKNYNKKVAKHIERMGQQVADEMATYAKHNAPWTDRTGHARQSIRGRAGWEKPTVFFVGVSGGMEYSPYLELAMDKKYAILAPTLYNFENKIYGTVGKALKTAGGK